MTATIKPIRRCNSIKGLGAHMGGAGGFRLDWDEPLDFSELWRRVWAPPDRRPIWQWAEQHVLAIPYSPNPGAFRIANSPHLLEVFDAIIDPRVRLVSIIAAIQSGKTTASEVALAYIIANLPGPTLWLNETDEDAKDQSESRLQKLFDSCPPVRALYPANRHHKRNTTIHFANGMTLWVVGAHNRTNLQRRSIRWLFGDETWQWPSGRMAEAEARVTAFGWLGKCIFSSQAGEEGDDTHRKFLTTDMREWTFACPECGYRQPYKWENIEWSKDAKDENGHYNFGRVAQTASLRCEGCGVHLPDSEAMRRRLNATGLFVVQNSNASPENVGFHWNALATMSWGKLAELYLRAKTAAREGDLSLLKQFYQKRLALPWREVTEDFVVEVETGGYKMGELWEGEAQLDKSGRVVTSGGVAPLRVLTVDVQMDKFFAVVRAWGADGCSRLLWCESLGSWEDLNALRERFEILPGLVFVDSNYDSFAIYQQCGARGWNTMIGDYRMVFAHRAADGRIVQKPYSPRHRVAVKQGTCSLYRFSASAMKDLLAGLRRGGMGRWGLPDDVSGEYLQHLESERKVQKGGKWVWEQIGNRPNHYWDCEVMQVCAAVMMKLVGAEKS